MNQKKIARKIRIASACLLVKSSFRLCQRFGFSIFGLSSYTLGSRTKMSTNAAATKTSKDPNQNGYASFLATSIEPTEVPNTRPSPPIKLMIPLACDRSLEGVTSGINATTGVRQKAIARMVVMVQATKIGREAASGTRPKAIAAIGAPTKMKGKRLPSLVRRRSDHAPTGG